jgi:hypothetical protein
MEAGGAIGMSAKTRRRLLAALVRDYARSTRFDAAGKDPDPTPPLDHGVLTAAEVAVTVAGMLRAAEVTSFEIAALFNV